ncbi:hypothetical protein SeMB42_g05372 [Synchytrium endobioticum]|uniref:F-box domain-containing protein n=1 Tax=Synchytrium endobioticum TaxID=286115 RepID=A0A507CRV1_9FUNG|nr:hypothetical protein SeMB42_g05372 [Synchytrium endobioticum]
MNALSECLKNNAIHTFPYPSYVKELSVYEFRPVMGDCHPTDLEISIKLIQSVVPCFANLSSLHLFFGFPDATIGRQPHPPFPYDVLPSCIPALRSLQIWNSYRPSPHLEAFAAACTQLVRFDVAFVHIDACVLTLLMRTAPNLTHLHLNAVTGISNVELVAALAQSPHRLAELSYRGAQPLDTPQIHRICSSQAMLRYLGIVGDALTPAALAALATLPRLARLELEWTPHAPADAAVPVRAPRVAGRGHVPPHREHGGPDARCGAGCCPCGERQNGGAGQL